MSKLGLTALYQALVEPIGPHLDDETVAEIASAEAAGENVDQMYAIQLQHIESCVKCAEAYASLVEGMLAATTDMAETANVLASRKTYEDQLGQLANSIWGRVIEISSAVTGGWRSLRLSLAPPTVVPTLGNEPIGADWVLLSQQFGQPLPLMIEVRARRLTEVMCQLAVRVDRLGLTEVAGRSIEIAFDDQVQRALTDDQGVALFGSIPITVVAQLTIRVQE